MYLEWFSSVVLLEAKYIRLSCFGGAGRLASVVLLVAPKVSSVVVFVAFVCISLKTVAFV